MNSTNLIISGKSFFLTYINTFRGLPKSVWKILTTQFIATTLSGTLYFLSYYFVHVLKYDIKTAAFFISCYGLGSILGGLLGGKLSDICSPKIVSVMSLVLEAMAFFFFLEFQTKILLIINMTLFGIASYSFITSNYIWALNSCENNESQKLKAINILTVISNLGLSLAATLLGLIKNISFPALFICYGSIYLMLAINLVLSQSPNDNKKIIKNYNCVDRYNAQKSFVYIMLFSVFLVGIIIAQMSSTYSLYIYGRFPEYGLRGFSILFLINTILVVTIQAPIGSFISGKNNIQFVGYGALLIGLGMAVLSFSTFFFEVIMSCIMYTIGEIIFFSLSLLVCYENSPPEKRGQWAGIYRMTFAASRAVGPIIGGLIYHHYSGKILWLFCFLLGASTFLICKLLRFYNKTSSSKIKMLIFN